ncbi:hypothetical protein [Rhodoplanes elegans]|nr:hypothetical protein [Rhodoplanes elegans]
MTTTTAALVTTIRGLDDPAPATMAEDFAPRWPVPQRSMKMPEPQ